MCLRTRPSAGVSLSSSPVINDRNKNVPFQFSCIPSQPTQHQLRNLTISLKSFVSHNLLINLIEHNAQDQKKIVQLKGPLCFRYLLIFGQSIFFLSFVSNLNVLIKHRET